MLVLRAAAVSDAAAVAAIWGEGWRDGHLGHVPDTLVAVRTAELFEERAAARVGDTVVAVIDEQVVAFAMVVADEVEQVYVSRAHRGTGVARALLAEAERVVAASGHAQAWLAVASGNQRRGPSIAAMVGRTRGRSATSRPDQQRRSRSRVTATSRR